MTNIWTRLHNTPIGGQRSLNRYNTNRPEPYQPRTPYLLRHAKRQTYRYKEGLLINPELPMSQINLVAGIRLSDWKLHLEVHQNHYNKVILLTNEFAGRNVDDFFLCWKYDKQDVWPSSQLLTFYLFEDYQNLPYQQAYGIKTLIDKFTDHLKFHCIAPRNARDRSCLEINEYFSIRNDRDQHGSYIDRAQALLVNSLRPYNPFDKQNPYTLLTLR